MTRLGWERVEADSGMPDVIAYKSSWVEPRREWVANYLENRPLGCSYVLTTDGSFDPLSKFFAADGLLMTRDEVLEAVYDLTDDGALRTIGRLGLLAHGPMDRHVFANLAATIATPHSDWQRYALYALSNTSWFEFDSVIEACLERGAFDEELARGAVSMLRDLRSSKYNDAFYSEPDDVDEGLVDALYERLLEDGI